MEKPNSIFLEIKKGNRNRIFHKIREAGSISRPALARELGLSMPTVTQNLAELVDLGYIRDSGSVGHTGGRRAKVYSVAADRKLALGVDLTRNRVSVIAADLNGDIVFQSERDVLFSKSEEYLQTLGSQVTDIVRQLGIKDEDVLGVGIALPALITEDYQRVFYGKILDITNMSVQTLGKYIPYPCRLYNDADAAGYAEISHSRELSNAFYIGLNNNIGGAVLIDHNVYKGQSPRSGEIGHMTMIPGGEPCYCGQRGCLECYCNADILASRCGGKLDAFFERLEKGNAECAGVWEDYLGHLAIAVNNVRMLFDCEVILGGYVGGYMEPYLPHLKQLVLERNPFDAEADFLRVCKVKRDALALGSALPYIHEFWKEI